MEQLLSRQPCLLGERFTLADASAYGQLGMNLVDGRAAELLRELAPHTFQWLCMIREGEHRGSRRNLEATQLLTPLLQCICETFIPLMQQNDAAYREAVAGWQAPDRDARDELRERFPLLQDSLFLVEAPTGD